MGTPCLAWAQSAAITTAALGNVAAAANGVTTFEFNPTGAVSKLSGSGVRMSTGSVVFNVTVSCTTTQCDKLNSLVKIGSTGAPTGRAGSLANFTIAMGTATLVSGPTGTNPITLTIGAIGKNHTATFSVGADFPIKGDDSAASSGAAASAMYVTVSKTDGTSATTSGGTASANVYRSLSITNSSALNFGRIVRPLSGSGTVAMAASTGTRIVSAGVGLPSPAPTRATFTVQGEGGQTVSVTAPSTITLTNAANNTLAVTTSNTAQGAQQLSGSLGTAGSLTFYVGGSFPISSATPSGVYSSTFTVTAAYN